MSIKSSMRAFLGPGKFEKFLQKEVFPKLEDLVDRGDMSETAFNHYSKLFWIKGSSALDFNLHYLEMPTLTTMQEDGMLAYAKLDIGNNKTLTYFVKQATSKEDFEIGVNAQGQLNKFLQGTAYEGRVPEVNYVDNKKRVVINSYVGGETFKTSLSKMKQEDRLTSVKLAIDDYVGLYNLMNSPNANVKVSRGSLVNRWIKDLVGLWKVEEPKKHTVLDFPEQLANFTDYFSKRYSSNEELVDLVDKEIGSFLNARSKYNIHGDYHGHNLVANLKNKSFEGNIDWSSVTSNGFPEFDLRKLLVKSDLTFENEITAAKYAATKIGTIVDDQEDSFKSYVLNRVIQGLYASEKYFHASDDNQFFNSSREQKHKAMAAVLYTDTTKWMNFAVEKGYISKELVEKLHENAPSQVDNRVKDDLKIRKLTSLSNELYEEFRKDHNPYKLMSQENLDLPMAEKKTVSPKEQLKNMSKKLKTNYLTRIAKMVAIPLVAGSLLAGAWYVNNLNNEKEKAEIVAEYYKTQSEENARSTFQSVFEKTHLEQLVNLSDDYTLPVEANSDLVRSLAKSKGLDPLIAMRILQNNRTYARFETGSGFSNRQSGVVVFDPIVFYDSIYTNNSSKSSLDPRWNISIEEEISMGMDRLVDCISQYDSLPEDQRLIHGLYDFYNYEKFGNPFLFSGENASYDVDERSKLRKNISELVYSALYGRYAEFKMLNFSYISLSSPRGDFPTYEDIYSPSKPDADSLRNDAIKSASDSFKNGAQGWSPGNNIN